MSETPSFAVRLQGAAKPEVANPSLTPEEKKVAAAEQRRRIPMSGARTKLWTPEIPGFHLHWINDYPGRIMQAEAAGYQFVEAGETMTASRDLAGDVVSSGTDMGSRVSVVVGANQDGSPLRAFLMKIRDEWYQEDQEAIAKRVDAVDEAMRQGMQEPSGIPRSDLTHRYVKSVNLKSTYSRKG